MSKILLALNRQHLVAALVLMGVFLPSLVRSQCVGLPAVTSLGSNKFPTGLCAPVQANVTYTVAFATTVTNGDLQVVYDWGDGSLPEVVQLTPGQKMYNTSRSHEYPGESDCEYFVNVVVRYNGKVCTNTSQLQKVSSWRTDNFNGGELKLTSPTSKSSIHLVCEGEDLSVVLNDRTNWNCNTPAYFSDTEAIESPNTENRWQQIIYNTRIPGRKIPNVTVNGIVVTGASGQDVRADYHDTRGMFYMSAPVVMDDKRRRSSLPIFAKGGFGPGFPKAGDEFEVTLRYWNFCNPYDDPEIPGPPADLLNGDHPPVETVAIIRVVSPPAAPVANNQSVCFGSIPSDFSVSGVGSGNVVNWYRYVPGTEARGELIASTSSTSLALTSHPEWKGKNKAGVFSVWATQRSKTGDGTNCESPPILVTRTVRESLVVLDPVVSPPTEVCNRQTFTVAMPPSPDGATKYTWGLGDGIKLTSSDATNGTFQIDVADFGSALYVDRTLTAHLQYRDGPSCTVSKSFKIRIYRSPVGGTLTGLQQVCETTDVGSIVLSAYTGTIARWEVKTGEGVYAEYKGNSSGGTISPGELSPGTYTYRAIVKNGSCGEVVSEELRLDVSPDPGTAYAGEDQFICSELQSAALNANNPLAGSGIWTYVSSVPAGLPTPAFNPRDPATTVVIDEDNAGVYTLRWTVTNGICQSADEVVIDFGTPPTDPNAGADQVVCGVATDLRGNVPLKGQGRWSVVSGPARCEGEECGIRIISPSSSTSRVELKGDHSNYGQYILRWEISSGGNNCFLKSDEVVVTFEQPVTVESKSIHGVCLDGQELAPVLLEGIVHGPATDAQWINVDGSGTLSASTSISGEEGLLVTAYYHPSYTDYLNDKPVQVKLVATPRNSACGIVENAITIGFQSRPVASAGQGSLTVCSAEATLNAVLPEGTRGWWTSEQPGVTFADPSDPQTVVSNLPQGVTSLFWTITRLDHTCASVASRISITRALPPTTIDIAPQECGTEGLLASIHLSTYEDQVTPLERTNRRLTWYKGRVAPATELSGEMLRQSGVANGQVYIARVTDLATGCSSDARVTIGVRPPPSTLNTVISRCEDVAGSNMVSGIDLNSSGFISAVTSEPNVEVRWYNNADDASADRFRISAPVWVKGKATFFAKVTYLDNPACHAIAALELIVNPQPAVTSILGRESVCQSASTTSSDDLPVFVYQVAPIPGAKYYWEIPDDPQKEFRVFGGGKLQDFYVLLQFPNAHTGTIKVRAELNGCSGPVVEKQISVSPAPAKPLITGPSVVCENSTSVSFRVKPDNYPSSVYNWEIRSVSDNSTSDAYIAEGQLTGNVLVNFGGGDVIISVRESNAECVSPVATRVIKVADPPKAKLVVDQPISCFMSADGILRTEVSGGTGPFRDFKIIESGQSDPDHSGIFRGLSQGSYTVRLTDANGCTATSNTQVFHQPSQIVITQVEVTRDGNGFNVSCADATDGAISVEFSGGNGPDYSAALYKYNSQEPPRIVMGRERISFEHLSAGTYSVSVEDGQGCSSLPSIAFVVAPPALYGGAIGPDQVICSGDDPAPIREISPAQGGTGVYEYEWQQSEIGDVYNDAVWTAIEGANTASFDPAVMFTKSASGEQIHFRRLVRSVPLVGDRGQVCEVRGKTEKVTITVNPRPEVSFTTQTTNICEGDAVAIDLRLTKGRAPFTFDYSTSTGTFSGQRGPVHTVITFPDLKSDKTISLLSLTDANGCKLETLPAAIDLSVIRVNPEFSVDAPLTECDGGNYTFRWTAQDGVDYRWEWGDGTTTELPSSILGSGENVLIHSYQAKSGKNFTEYTVKLFASVPRCLERSATKLLRIAPAIRLNILASDTLLCSGSEVRFHNNSMGVGTGRWYYRAPDTGKVISPKSSELGDQTLVFHNTTTTNPLIYEVFYEARNNAGCSQVYKQDIYVFRENNASFAIDSVPAFEGHSAIVKIRHTSDVVDSDQFDYLWSFGQHGTQRGNDPSVEYFSPGEKDILLRIVNRAARDAGKSCASEYRQTISIPVSDLGAVFTASPSVSCTPATIRINNTTRGADTFLWRLYRRDSLISTSNLRNPGFEITTGGIYDIYLNASVSSTGQSDEAWVRGVTVFDAPRAAFELQSKVVFVPDTEAKVINFSWGANTYSWMFGDGSTSEDTEPRHAYAQDGKYEIALIAGRDWGLLDVNGDGVADERLVCYDTTRREVTAINGGELQIPNAFTPDSRGIGGNSGSNGINDTFLPLGKGIMQFHMQVFDRWGTMVFESRDKDTGWDGSDRNGRLLPAGVYVFKLLIRTSAGTNISRVGDVTLIR